MENESSIDFGDLPTQSVDWLDTAAPSDLYTYALEFRDALPYWPALHSHVARSLARASRPDVPVGELTTAVRSIRATRCDQVAQWKARLANVSRELCTWIVQQYAPAGLVDGCLLRTAIDIRLNETKLGAASLRLYSREVGAGRATRHHGEMFRALAASLNLELPDLSAGAFYADNDAMSAIGGGDLLDSSFVLPNFQLAISAFSQRFLPELLGANLYYYTAGLSPALLGLAPRLRELGGYCGFLDAHELGADFTEFDTLAIQAAGWLLNGECGDYGGDGPRARRLWNGFETVRILDTCWTEAVAEFLRAGGLSPAQQMQRLIERRGVGAVGYHMNLCLAGRKLDEWLAEAGTRPADFLEAFGKSGWISPGKPEASRFLTHVAAYGGPMFGIFSESELEVFRRWIRALPARDSAATEQLKNEPYPRVPSRPVAEETTPQLDFSSWFDDSPAVARVIAEYAARPLGAVYTELFQIETRPKILPFARHYVEAWLERARRLFHPSTAANIQLSLADVTPREEYELRPYSRGDLDARVALQHQRQRNSFVPMIGAPPMTREQLIGQMRTAAPGALIDGAWLQGIGSLLARPRVTTAALFQIYADELGYGHLDRNHNVVARQCFESMEFVLPAVTDPSFPNASELVEEHYRLPLFWLCISQFPKRYLPELLGLTLAIEVNGVGGAYRSVAQLNEYFGLDSYLFDLHNTIDNVDAGHTRWIRDAVHAYLDSMHDQGGATLQAAAWERVWCGVCAWAVRGNTVY